MTKICYQAEWQFPVCWPAKQIFHPYALFSTKYNFHNYVQIPKCATSLENVFATGKSHSKDQSLIFTRSKTRAGSCICIYIGGWEAEGHCCKEVIQTTFQWLCSHGLESRSERRFRTWFGPSWFESLILAHVNAKLFQIRLLKRVLKCKKIGVLDRDPPRKPDSRTCECKALSERDSCVCILKMRAEAMHKRMGQSAHADCAVGAKYYLPVCRSWSWLGRRLQCMWTHVVQITISIMFWIAIRNVFRNVILAYVNTAYDSDVFVRHEQLSTQ